MISRETQVDVGSLRDGMPERTDVVVGLTTRDGAVRLIARDAATGQFAGLSVTRAPGSSRPAGVTDEALVRLLALSPAGTHLLHRDPADGNRLALQALVSGTVVTLPPGLGGGANAAAFAPDGKRIAELRRAGDKAVVAVLDVEGSRRSDLWSTEGGTSSDTVVSWSPDGRLLAVSYVDPDDFDHTVVMNGEGTAVMDFPQMAICGGSRLGWTGDHDLLLIHESWEDLDVPQPIVLADPATGERREVAQPQDLGVFGALDGRVLRLGDEGRVVSTAFDGSDPRPVLDVGPDHAITFLDAIPGALDAGG